MTIVCVVSLLLFATTAGASSGKDLMKSAAAHSGESVIRTAMISFAARIADAPRTPEEIAQIVEGQEATVKQAIAESRKRLAEYRKAHPGRERSVSELDKRYEKALEGFKDLATKQLIANTTRTVAGVYLIGGPQFGGDRLVEFRIRRGYEDAWGQQMALLYRRLDAGRQTSLVLDVEARSAVASGRMASAGITDPHKLGRLQGILLSATTGGGASDAAAPKVLGRFSPSEIAFEVDEKSPGKRKGEVNVIAFAKKAGASLRIGRVVVDTSRDYICPLIEEYDESGGVMQSWECDSYFQNGKDGIWFPAKCRYSRLSAHLDLIIREFAAGCQPARRGWLAAVSGRRFRSNAPAT